MDQRARIEPKDQWEKKLREKLMDYQAPIDQLPPLQLPVERQRRPLLWLVWGGAVAAAVILLLLLLHQDNEPIDQLLQSTDGEIAKIVEPIKHIDHEKGITQVDQFVANHRAKKLEPTHEIMSQESIIEEVASDLPEKEVHEEPVVVEKEVNSEQQSPLEELRPYEKSITVAPKEQRPIKLSVNLSGASTSGGGVGDTSTRYSLVSVTDSRYFEPIKEQFFTKELAPIELAVTAILPLSKRWSLESGVQYAYRQLNVTSNLGSEFIAKIHAVGIPLNLQYYFADLGRWKCYGSAGASGMFPVSVAYKGDGIKKLKQSFYLDTHLSVGAEYSITNSMSLYGAIGGGYDLVRMNKELFSTADSRWHLKMNAGVRFEIK
ncbi:outer membrane beta-barrel protein [uncultured Porphyromonas sp.]|uniref:outer membrane beta-barrel protein n=1 Tax=uncultured Porphyromonas sp. TaxID=159274 RepID=UPI00258A50E6|nr:outer membrane beta-barrel protein [uncultured Porphyromonas sp.]